MRKVPEAMRIIVIASTLLRPILSASGPKNRPPSGLTRKATAKRPATMTWPIGPESFGRRTPPITTAREPYTPKSYHSVMLPMAAAPIARFVTSGLVTVISSGRHRRRTLSGPNTSSPSVGGHERRETAVIWNHTQKICARPSLLCESSVLLGGRTVGQHGLRLVLSALMASPTPVPAAIVPAGPVTRPAPRPAPVGMVRAD